jgi:hypothetical protein
MRQQRSWPAWQVVRQREKVTRHTPSGLLTGESMAGAECRAAQRRAPAAAAATAAPWPCRRRAPVAALPRPASRSRRQVSLSLLKSLCSVCISHRERNPRYGASRRQQTLSGRFIHCAIGLAVAGTNPHSSRLLHWKSSPSSSSSSCAAAAAPSSCALGEVSGGELNVLQKPVLPPKSSQSR